MCVRHLGDNQRQQFAFVRDVERIKAEHLAGTLDRLAHRYRALIEHHANVGAFGDLVERSRNTAARRVAQHVDEVLRVLGGRKR